MTATPPRITAPKPRRDGKGEPPKTAADTVVVGNNTPTPSDSPQVANRINVKPEYRKNFRLFCASHDLGQVEAFKEAIADYMKKKGWPPEA